MNNSRKLSAHQCKVDMKEFEAKLAERNTRLVRSIGMDEKNHMFALPTLTAEKINKRIRDSVTVLPSYCPFCGEPMS
jgi:hypothetical protein